MISIIKRTICILTGNDWAQHQLSLAMQSLAFFAGLGSGGSPKSSGEVALVKLLKEIGGTRDRIPCVFDVGANKGGFIKMLKANLSGTAVSIHAFEPGNAAFEKLTQRADCKEGVILNNFGLGASPGELPLYYSEPGSVLASLSKRRLDHFKSKTKEPKNMQHETVRIETLDSYCSERGIHKIDLLKIDVEGHELDVMKGALGMLNEGKIRYLTFEFGGCNIDSKIFFQDYWYFFKQYPNSKIYRFTPSGYLLPIRKYQESHECFLVSNYLVDMGDGNIST